MKAKQELFILFIDDDPIDRIAFKRFASSPDFPYKFKIAGSLSEALELMRQEDFDTIVSDFNLGDGNALKVIKKTVQPTIIITGIGDGETAVKAMKAGAYDFLIKDNSGDYLKTLPVAIENAVKHYNAEKELVEYRENLEEIVKQRTRELENEIEERKKTEKELLLATKKAKEADRLKSAFLANMSHEIRTPMNAILGFSGLLNNDKLTKQERSNYTSIIQSNSNQLLTIISDIIDISKIESNQLKIKPVTCHINNLLANLHTQLNAQKQELKKENIQITYQISLSDENCLIKTDEIRLTQVLNNLLSNALKFTEEGEIEFGYSLSGSKHLLFFVKDTGIGIKKDKVPIIFERFRQSEESNTRDYGGTGLGLSISKGLVELLGGNLTVNSTYGQGSTFFFTLPYKTTDYEKIPENTIYNPKSKPIKDFSDKTILVVDDREDVLKYIAILLEPTNAKLLFSKDGLDAVEKYKQHHHTINLILMDIQLPGIDGYEAVKRIKLINNQVPVVIQTAFAFNEDKDKFKELGCYEYITKPIKEDVFMATISGILQ